MDMPTQAKLGVRMHEHRLGTSRMSTVMFAGKSAKC